MKKMIKFITYIFAVSLMVSCSNKQETYKNAFANYSNCLKQKISDTILSDSTLNILKHDCMEAVKEKFSLQKDSSFLIYFDSIVKTSEINAECDSILLSNINKKLVQYTFKSGNFEIRTIRFDGDLFTLKYADLGFNFETYTGSYRLKKGVNGNNLIDFKFDNGDEMTYRIHINPKDKDGNDDIWLEGKRIYVNVVKK